MSMERINEKMRLGYNESIGNSSRVRVSRPVEETPMMVVRNNNTNNNITFFKGTFRECLKNHAVNNGGHVRDGCCEFLPAGSKGSIDALKCTACNCHRNFHRNENPLPLIVIAVDAPAPTGVIPAGDAHPPYNTHFHHSVDSPQYMLYHLPKGLLHVIAAPPNDGDGPSGLSLISRARGGGGEDHDDAMDYYNGGIGSCSNSKKRFRTKFTPELKERLDWRIKKQDDVVVEELCNENGVKRQVLKVSMHNNTHL